MAPIRIGSATRASRDHAPKMPCIGIVFFMPIRALNSSCSAAIITISVFSDPATPVSAASYRSFIRDSSHYVLSGQSFSREALFVRTMSRPS